MKIQNIQSQNTNFAGLYMPKKLKFNTISLGKNVLKQEDVLANNSIKDASDKFDVVIKKNKLHYRRNFTENEVAKIFVGATGLGIMAGLGVASLTGGVNPAMLMTAGFFGGMSGLSTGWLAANLMDDYKLTPKENEYILQVGENYNENSEKFEGKVISEHHIQKADEITKINIFK